MRSDGAFVTDRRSIDGVWDNHLVNRRSGHPSSPPSPSEHCQLVISPVEQIRRELERHFPRTLLAFNQFLAQIPPSRGEAWDKCT